MTITWRNEQYNRDAWLEINLKKLEANFHHIKSQLSSSTQILSVLKSDAYGHGATVLAPILESLGVYYFGVASIDEGIALRESGIKTNILILSPIPLWSINKAIEHNLDISIHSESMLNAIKNLNLNQAVNIQVFFNTGMNREGIAFTQTNILDDILNTPRVFDLTGVYTHLAYNDTHEFSNYQLLQFHNILNQYSDKNLGLKHISASHSYTNSNYHFDMIRIGLELFMHQPILSLYARLSVIQELISNNGVGYSHTWISQSNTSVGLLPLGYADGVSRGLSNCINIYHKQSGIACPQVGNISMDQLSINLQPLIDNNIEFDLGNIFELIGENVNVNTWADYLNTINYEVLCNLRMRLPRVYTQS